MVLCIMIQNEPSHWKRGIVIFFIWLAVTVAWEILVQLRCQEAPSCYLLSQNLAAAATIADSSSKTLPPEIAASWSSSLWTTFPLLNQCLRPRHLCYYISSAEWWRFFLGCPQCKGNNPRSIDVWRVCLLLSQRFSGVFDGSPACSRPSTYHLSYSNASSGIMWRCGPTSSSMVSRSESSLTARSLPSFFETIVSASSSSCILVLLRNLNDIPAMVTWRVTD